MMNNQDRAIYEAAVAASTATTYLGRAEAGMAALGAHHAHELRLEKVVIQKRHARHLIRKVFASHRFDWKWYREESKQNDRTVRIVGRWFRRFWDSPAIGVVLP